MIMKFGYFDSEAEGVDVVDITWPGMAKRSLQEVSTAGMSWSAVYGATFNPLTIKVKVRLRGDSRDPARLAQLFNDTVIAGMTPNHLNSTIRIRYGSLVNNLWFDGMQNRCYEAWLVEVSAFEFHAYTVSAWLTFYIPVGLTRYRYTLRASVLQNESFDWTRTEAGTSGDAPFYGVFMPSLVWDGTATPGDDGLFTAMFQGIYSGRTLLSIPLSEPTRVSIDFDNHSVKAGNSLILPTLDSEWPVNLGGSLEEGDVQSYFYYNSMYSGSFSGTMTCIPRWL